MKALTSRIILYITEDMCQLDRFWYLKNMRKGFFCMLGNFACFFFLLSADFFSKLFFSKKIYGNTVSGSNSLDPDLSPNCLQR